MVDGAEPFERERTGHDVLGERGLERVGGEDRLLLAPLEGRQLAREAAELGPALLEEVILVGLVALEGELGLEARSPHGVEGLALGGGARLGVRARLAP